MKNNKLSLTDDKTLSTQTTWFKTQLLKPDSDVFKSREKAISRIKNIMERKNKDLSRILAEDKKADVTALSYFNRFELEKLHDLLNTKGEAKLRNTVSKALARNNKSPKVSFQCKLPSEESNLLNGVIAEMGISREQLMLHIARKEFDELKALLKPKIREEFQPDLDGLDLIATRTLP